MMSVAAGLAREGLIPVTGTYGVFASGAPGTRFAPPFATPI